MVVECRQGLSRVMRIGVIGSVDLRGEYPRGERYWE